MFLYRLFDNVLIDITARRLKDVKLFGGLDPYLAVYVKEEDEWKELFRTNIARNTLKPRWDTVKIRSSIFREKEGSKFTTKVFSRNRVGSDTLIGSAKIDNIFLVEENKENTTKVVIRDRTDEKNLTGIVIFNVTRNTYEKSKHVVIPYHLVSNTSLSDNQS